MKFRQKYSDEELIEMARGYSDYATLHKENRSLYDTIHRRGLEERAYAHFSHWGRKIWTLEAIIAKAQECGMEMKVFRKRYSGAYWTLRERGWLDIVFPNRRKNKAPYSIVYFRKTLGRAKSLRSWRQNNKYLSNVAYQRGWFVSEDERLTKLAEGKGLEIFNTQYAKNILSNCAIITEENIRKKARFCTERKIFRKKFPKHYRKACVMKILDSVCEHMPPSKSREFRAIYAAEFSDGSVYVGLSYDLEDRWEKHLKDKRSAVYIHSQKMSLKPSFKMVHDYVPKEIAKVLEGEYKDKYSSEGWKILNRAKTGGLGSSIRKLSEQYIYNIVSSCESYTDFRMKYGSVYNAARRLGILLKIKEIIEPQIKITKWVDHPEIIKEIASKCKTHHEFYTNYDAAARAAVELGIYDEITKHMPPKRLLAHTKDSILSRIKEGEFETYTDFTKDQATYNAANKLGLLVQIKKMLPVKEKEPFYSIEYLHSITINYSSLAEFNKAHHNLYEYIRTHNLSTQLFGHFVTVQHRIFNDEFAINESKKYRNVTEIAEKDMTLYNYLRKHSLLDITFPNRRKVNNKRKN
jgi:predicted GIY-YIG superfamily endonuclease